MNPKAFSSSTTKVLLSVFYFAQALAFGAETIIVSEQFADGSHLGQNPPASLEWFSLSKSDDLQAEPGKLSLVDAVETVRQAVAHFADLGKAIHPKPGQSLVLTFDFTVREDIRSGRNAFRFGLFDSRNEDENRFSGDARNSDKVTSEGYIAFLHIQADSSSKLTIAKRSGTGRLLTISDAVKKIDSQPFSNRLTTEETYTAELRITPMGSAEATISATILDKSGNSPPMTLEYMDAVDVPSAFDTVAIAIFSGISQMDIANVKIVLVPAK